MLTKIVFNLLYISCYVEAGMKATASVSLAMQHADATKRFATLARKFAAAFERSLRWVAWVKHRQRIRLRMCAHVCSRVLMCVHMCSRVIMCARVCSFSPPMSCTRITAAACFGFHDSIAKRLAMTLLYCTVPPCIEQRFKVLIKCQMTTWMTIKLLLLFLRSLCRFILHENLFLSCSPNVLFQSGKREKARMMSAANTVSSFSFLRQFRMTYSRFKTNNIFKTNELIGSLNAVTCILATVHFLFSVYCHDNI